MVERPEKGGADSISAAEAARAAGAKLGLGVLVPGHFEVGSAAWKGECGRNYMGPGFDPRRLQSRGRSSAGRAMFPLRNRQRRFPLSPDREVTVKPAQAGQWMEPANAGGITYEPSGWTRVQPSEKISPRGMARHASLSPVPLLEIINACMEGAKRTCLKSGRFWSERVFC